jgi:hypothetical protein
MNPAWSHDGTLLAYSTEAEGRQRDPSVPVQYRHE